MKVVVHFAAADLAVHGGHKQTRLEAQQTGKLGVGNDGFGETVVDAGDLLSDGVWVLTAG